MKDVKFRAWDKETKRMSIPMIILNLRHCNKDYCSIQKSKSSATYMKIQNY